MIVDRHEPYLELMGKGFKAIGYSLKCPGCGHKNTVALMEYWACYDCGTTFYNLPELGKEVTKMVTEYNELHQQGSISVENLEIITGESIAPRSFHMEGDLGIQVAKDGRVWVCINGIAFLRFKPTTTEIKIKTGTISEEVILAGQIDDLNRKVCEHGNLRTGCPDVKCRTAKGAEVHSIAPIPEKYSPGRPEPFCKSGE